MLAVIAIIAIIAGLLLPALAAGKARAKQAGCANNLKQFAVGINMYSADNAGTLVANPAPNTQSPLERWVQGSMKTSYEATNQTLLQQGALYRYVGAVPIYHCPADEAQSGGASHVRSYSMNGWMGSRYMQATGQRDGYRTFVREGELANAGASSLWVIMDEDVQTLDDGWFLVTMDDSRPFANLPGARHRRGYTANFADGHVDFQKVRPDLASQATPNAKLSPDWLALKEMTTTR